jgi:hypothetical protein
MEATLTTYSAAEVLEELLSNGYSLSVITRVEEVQHRAYGSQFLTYGHKVYVKGPESPPKALLQAIRANRDALLAAACVLEPPVPWLQVLVRRHMEGRVPVSMLAANVASFMGLHPAHDGERLERIIEEVLR